jgi:hypothetical protein
LLGFRFEVDGESISLLTRSYKLNLIRIVPGLNRDTLDRDASNAHDSPPIASQPRNVFKDGLAYLQAHYPAIKAVFLGTRDCDPFAGMETSLL